MGRGKGKKEREKGEKRGRKKRGYRRKKCLSRQLLHKHVCKYSVHMHTCLGTK